jgi:hypothetical protein
MTISVRIGSSTPWLASATSLAPGPPIHYGSPRIRGADMNGKIVGVFILLAALLAGAGVYWTQVYAYYHTVAATDAAAEMRLITISGSVPEPLVADDFQGIDASSSPKRFRACFTTPQSLAMLSETYVAAERPEPTVGPSWFDCYDAKAIGEALERGEALAFLSEPEIHPGIDRVIAVFADGRAFAWHQLAADAERPLSP